MRISWVIGRIHGNHSFSTTTNFLDIMDTATMSASTRQTFSKKESCLNSFSVVSYKREITGTIQIFPPLICQTKWMVASCPPWLYNFFIKKNHLKTPSASKVTSIRLIGGTSDNSGDISENNSKTPKPSGGRILFDFIRKTETLRLCNFWR